MDTIITSTLVMAMLTLVIVYYFRVFRQLIQKPMLLFIYLLFWIIVFFITYTVLEKTYFNSNEITNDGIESKGFINI